MQVSEAQGDKFILFRTQSKRLRTLLGRRSRPMRYQVRVNQIRLLGSKLKITLFLLILTKQSVVMS